MSTVEDQLCTRCGLCCDGSLFADVELANRREATRAESLGLELDDDDTVFLQPCPALKNKRCTIYQFRPNCCRTFECRILQQAKRGHITIPDAQAQITIILKHVQRIHSLLAQLPSSQENEPRLSLKERCQDALAELDSRQSARLESALATLESHLAILNPI